MEINKSKHEEMLSKISDKSKAIKERLEKITNELRQIQKDYPDDVAMVYMHMIKDENGSELNGAYIAGGQQETVTAILNAMERSEQLAYKVLLPAVEFWKRHNGLDNLTELLSRVMPMGRRRPDVQLVEKAEDLPPAVRDVMAAFFSGVEKNSGDNTPQS